jgi:hypothetical protein
MRIYRRLKFAKDDPGITVGLVLRFAVDARERLITVFSICLCPRRLDRMLISPYLFPYFFIVFLIPPPRHPRRPVVTKAFVARVSFHSFARIDKGVRNDLITMSGGLVFQVDLNADIELREFKVEKRVRIFARRGRRSRASA